MDVEIDLYSGRRNPVFSLAPEAAAELMSRIAALPPAPPGAAPLQGLGYRGLRITGGPAADIMEIVVSGGVVVARDRNGAERVLQDAGRSLERRLADLAAASLDPAEMSVLRQELRGGPETP
ncbi:hypothetical protein P2Q00_49870 [Streptomyces coacervatus]|uniref:hypothetical protein n=1 Tax=Streptomyces coacervatus TaxID=647381 RepID=UPI0023DB5BF6|nr:hypothetical protein [Streptomyces coacervatus]MDF2273441.1 hypothetical protein [Streptomyces coacervatus]